MTIGIGETKEEEREIFAAMKARIKEIRHKRSANASEYLAEARLLVDDGRIAIDPNGTWNWKLKGRGGQYWPTKGRWQYTSAKVIQKAAEQARKAGRPNELRYYTKDTLYGGGILKFLDWLRKEQ